VLGAVLFIDLDNFKSLNDALGIGIARFGAHPTNADELMGQADIAMCQAKAAGKNTIQFFDSEMQSAVVLRVRTEHALRLAIAAQQFHRVYQIQFDSDHHPLGAEALIRWMHPQRGLVSPALFIPIAESSGLIGQIGNWVLETACRQLQSWKQNGCLAYQGYLFGKPAPMEVFLSSLEQRTAEFNPALTAA
jgi:predicted signal transduction protein with EAL and GGDEF domain